MDVNMPKGRSLADEYAGTLNAQTSMAPSLFASEAQFQPLYNQLGLSNLDQMLMGSGARDYTSQEYTPALYVDKHGKYSYGPIPKGVAGPIHYPSIPDAATLGGGHGGGFNPSSLPGPTDAAGDLLSGNPFGSLGGLFGGGGGSSRKLVTPGSYQTTQHHLAAQRGLLDIYSQDVAPRLGELSRSEQAKQRTADIQAVHDLGPAAIQALRTANPYATSILDPLNDQAVNELGMGTQLSPDQMRLVQQSVRQGQAARGMGYGPSDIFGEALGTSAFGQQLQQQRRAFAGNVLGLDQGFYGDPFQRILGQPASGPGAAQSTVGQAAGLGAAGGPKLFNLESGYAQDLYNTNFNALANAAIANANNKNALIGAGISAVGSLAGGAMAACAVAREVYGEKSPKWKQFRDWLMSRAPVQFYLDYVKHGRALAAWLKERPEMKAIVRGWMDAKINSKFQIPTSKLIGWEGGAAYAV